VNWALAAPTESLREIARLRQVAGVSVCSAGSAVWLQGEGLDEPLSRALRVIPGGRQFSVLPDGQLIATGMLVPSGRLPGGPWQPLADWLTLQLPPQHQGEA